MHPCSTNGAVLRALRRSNCFGWLQVLDVFFNEILRPTNLDQHALHLVRNLIALFLLAACSAAVHLVHPDVDLLHSKETALLRMLSGTAAAGPAAGNVAGTGVGAAAPGKLPHRPLC